MPITTKQQRSRTLLIVAAAALQLLVSGCSGLPTINEATSVSLRTDINHSSGLAVDVDGNPEFHPGSMAQDATAHVLQSAAECPWCVLLALPTIPIAAATGAVITATETLPEDEAHELNRVSASIAAHFNFHGDLRTAMRTEAQLKGIELTHRNPDVILDITLTEFSWDVSLGNRIAIDAVFLIEGWENGRRGCTSVRYRSHRAHVEDWLRNGGLPIKEALNQLFEGASEKVWSEILDTPERT